MKHSIDTFGNRTRDLPACSEVPLHAVRVLIPEVNWSYFAKLEVEKTFRQHIQTVHGPTPCTNYTSDTTYDGRNGNRTPTVLKNRVLAEKAQAVILVRHMWPYNAIDHASVSRTCNE
jgi:hypothetical protein